MDLISVIIPVYNAEKYIERTVLSVLSQNYKNIEIILINDGSTDNSLDIMNKLKKENSKIKVITQNNKGVSAARNVGIENASGSYIIFLDADDYLADEALYYMFKSIQENDGDICLGLTKVIQLDGTPDVKSEENLEISCYSNIEVIKDMLLERSIYDLHSACAKLYKKSSLGNIKFTEGKSSNEDRFFFFKVLCNVKKCTCINKVVYLYEKHYNSLSTKKIDNRIFENIYFCDEMHKMIEHKYPELIEQSEYNKIITNLMVYRNIYRSGISFVKEYKSELNKIKKYVLDNYKNVKLSNFKKMEILVIKRFNCLYKLLLKIYDLR